MLHCLQRPWAAGGIPVLVAAVLAGCGGDSTSALPEAPRAVVCGSCHGDAESSAPPVDTEGGSDTSLVTVGAHRAHLGRSDWHAEIACEECHRVPTDPDEPGHMDASPAEVQWGLLSQSDGAAPTFNRDAATCSGVYCHGETLAGGTVTRPRWTRVDGTQARCGTCHGLPPSGSHPQRSDCGTCHGSVIDNDGQFVDPALHVDGLVHISFTACNTCHGNDSNWAPPRDTASNEDTALVTVGAHQAHLGSSDWHRQVLCADCHIVPRVVNSPIHLGPAPAELTFGAVATSDGAAPVFDRATARCARVYCHGTTLIEGGSRTVPVWTDVDGTQASCGTCHGLPPEAPHPPSAGCGGCHGEVHDGTRFVNPVLHVDGRVQVTGGDCGACHGNPPTPKTESYAGGGGAHDMHVTSLGYACSVCHGHDGSGPTHDEGRGRVLAANIDIAWDTKLSFPAGTTISNGSKPGESHNNGQPTCRVGCHNPIPGDKPELANLAVWTDPSIACTGCHERPGTESPWNHPMGSTDSTIRTRCQACHAPAGHLSGKPKFADPDPTDAFSYAAGGTYDLCRTCHDGGGGTFFGGRAPDDVSAFWETPGAHADAGQECESCHDYHGNASDDRLAADGEETLCGACHGEVREMSNAGTPTHHRVVDSEQTGPAPLECTTCHDPHSVSRSPWLPLTHPRTGNAIPAADVPRDASSDPTAALADSGRFCLICHDGSWPGAADIAAELASERTRRSQFFGGDENYHRKHVEELDERTRGLACSYCHNAHGNRGTRGIQRGALLYDWITVRRFPYVGKGSCTTADPLGACHR